MKFNNILLQVKDLTKPYNPIIFELADILDIKKVYLFQLVPQNDELQNNNLIDKDIYLDELLTNAKNSFPLVDQIQFEFLAFSREPLKEILKGSINLDIDLIICEYGSENLKREEIIKITKNSYCSVLVLPENSSSTELKNLLVPVDFSEYSKKALEFALEVSSKRKIHLVLNHVFFVPSTYHATGKSYEESAIIEKQMAKKECQKFLKELNAEDSNISYSYVLDDDKDPTDKIYKDALDNNADLIIFGSKGKTNSAEFLTGSIAFSILLYNKQVPMLIIKNKKANYDLAEDFLRNL